MKSISIWTLSCTLLLFAACNPPSADDLDPDGYTPPDTTLVMHHTDHGITDPNVINDSVSYTYNYMGQLETSSELTDSGRLFITYFTNGKIEKKEVFDQLEDCILPTGTHTFYDSLGVLMEQKRYSNDIGRDNMCQSTSTVIEYWGYYPDGSLMESGFYSTCFNCEETKCGKWTKYDENGEVKNTTNHSNCD